MTDYVLSQQNQEMAALMLKQQGELNELRARTTNFEDVGRFHRKFGLDNAETNGSGPREWDQHMIDFRTEFLKEELIEFMVAEEQRDHARMFDALLDLVYVALGTAHLLGYPWQEGWNEVQAANMSKLRAAADGSDSKRGSSLDVVKPEGWTDPDIANVLRLHGFEI